MTDCNYHHFLCFLRWAMDWVDGIGKWLTTHQLSSIPPSSYCWKQGISRGWGYHYVYPIIHLSIYLSNPTYKYTCVYTYTLYTLYRIYIYIYIYMCVYFCIFIEISYSTSTARPWAAVARSSSFAAPVPAAPGDPFSGEMAMVKSGDGNFFSAGNSPRKMVMGIGVLGNWWLKVYSAKVGDASIYLELYIE